MRDDPNLTPDGGTGWISAAGVLTGIFIGFCVCAVCLYTISAGRLRQAGPGIPVTAALIAFLAGVIFQINKKLFLAGLCLGLAVGSLMSLPLICLTGWHGS